MAEHDEQADIEQLRQVLRRSGQRLTPQRMLVLMTLTDHPGHITAEQILERIRPRYPYLNLSTVYRTLDLLISLGLVTETDVGEGARAFELIGSRPHHHLICQRCGVTVEIDDSVLEPLRARLLDQYSFAARMEHFAIFGLCAACRGETSG